MSDPDAFTDYERTVIRNIDEYGCHVTYVFDNNDQQFVPFSYSVGFPLTVNQGEVITFGLPMEIMQFMINETMKQCDQGLELVDGSRNSGLLEGFDVAVRRIPPKDIQRENFNSAMWFHAGEFGTSLTDAFQLVWPGAVDGLYPWDEGCAANVIDLQPALYDRKTVS